VKYVQLVLYTAVQLDVINLYSSPCIHKARYVAVWQNFSTSV